MRALVTGGAGFVGSALVDLLVAEGTEVVVYDDLSTGRRAQLERALDGGAELIEGDILDTRALERALRGSDVVFHLAANADVRDGLRHPRRDLEQNLLGTASVLDAVRAAGTPRLAFTSTGSVYGEPDVVPTPEDAPFPLQTSLYGASKVAAEALISAHCEGFGLQACIFRLVSVLGPRYTHGHVIDFVRALERDPSRLQVLGDGHQTKSYLHVSDCVAGIASLSAAAGPGCTVLNLGTDETSTVRDSVRWITDHMGLAPEVTYGGGRRGWVGDSPRILLDCARARRLGWEPAWTIEAAIRDTVDDLLGPPGGR